MRSQVRVLSLRPKNSRKQAIFTCFRLFFYIFFTKSDVFSWSHVCPDFEPLDCFFTVIFPLPQKIPFLCLLRCKFWVLTDWFLPALALYIIPTNWNLLFIILIYPAVAHDDLPFARLFDKAFKAFFELVGAFSRRINVSNTNAFVWLG